MGRLPPELASLCKGTEEQGTIFKLPTNAHRLLERPSATRTLLEHPQLSSKLTWKENQQSYRNRYASDTAVICSTVEDISQIELQNSDSFRAEDLDLALELKASIRRYLSLDAKNPSHNTSITIGALLEAVHILQDQVDALGMKFNKKASEVPWIESSRNPHHKTLHRICCHQTLHCHDQIIYEDEPYHDGNMIWGNDEVLRGDHPVFNIETYLKQQAGLHFVIVKEYDCVFTGDATLGDTNRMNAETRASRPRESLWIISPMLQMVLKDVSQSRLPTEDKSPTSLARLDAPYNILFHHHHELIALSQRDQLRGSVLKGLLSHVVTNYQSDHEDARMMFMNGLTCSAHLGKLFRPGQMVIASDAQTMASRVSILVECNTQADGSVNLKGWCWAFDGVRLIRARWSGTIAIGSREPTSINQLAVYPIDYASDKITDTIAKRGEKFWGMRHGVHLGYTGWDAHRQHQYFGSRFIIDTAAYKDLHSTAGKDHQIIKCDGMGPFELCLWPLDQQSGDGVTLDCWPTFIDVSDIMMPPEMYLLLPSSIQGYNLDTKCWSQLNIESLHDIVWDTGAFDKLIIQSEHKNLLQALTKSFKIKRQEWAEKDNIVNGKGNALIMLLHGAPGTGKTLTAECVANSIQKPLYRVTCGDIGTDPGSVESYLRSAFFIARRWDAVILMDEADVLLQSRSSGSLQRNAMVSVFLRLMEYYEGLLILTSNRVDTIDEAFKSRIHLAMHYKQLERAERLKVWNIFTQEIRPEMSEANFSHLERHLSGFAETALNGRQIKNTMITARQLAEFEKTSLTYEHVHRAIEASRKFDDYLQNDHLLNRDNDLSQEHDMEVLQSTDTSKGSRSISHDDDSARLCRSSSTTAVENRSDMGNAKDSTSVPYYISSALSKAWNLEHNFNGDEPNEIELNEFVEAFRNELRQYVKEQKNREIG